MHAVKKIFHYKNEWASTKNEHLLARDDLVQIGLHQHSEDVDLVVVACVVVADGDHGRVGADERVSERE